MHLGFSRFLTRIPGTGGVGGARGVFRCSTAAGSPTLTLTSLLLKWRSWSQLSNPPSCSPSLPVTGLTLNESLSGNWCPVHPKSDDYLQHFDVQSDFGLGQIVRGNQLFRHLDRLAVSRITSRFRRSSM